MNIEDIGSVEVKLEFLKGERGEKGDKGDKGDKGMQGEKGDTGATGEKGESGKSAYQYAQEGGYEGTEEKFYRDLASINNLDEMIDDINGEVV